MGRRREVSNGPLPVQEWRSRGENISENRGLGGWGRAVRSCRFLTLEVTANADKEQKGPKEEAGL